jgi:predicted PurR-regulated permease PerM
MNSGPTLRASVALIAAIAVFVAAYQANVVLAPLTLGLFIIALVWPLYERLNRRAPALLALAITMVVTIAVVLAFASLIVWGFGQVGRSIVSDAARYQGIYDAALAWLDRHGATIAGAWGDNVNLSRMLGWAQQLSSRVNTTLSFWLIALLYVVLGLMEVEVLRAKVEICLEAGAAKALLSATSDTARQFRRYMAVRTLMSIATGLLVGLFAWSVGLNLPIEWGVIAFTLNYIPFIGPFMATLFPTLLEMAQFTSWETILGIFICLNVIQFVIGSYVEPRVSGAVLSISPLLVLFATFFGAFLWGLYGTFIGVPIAIAAVTFCRYYPSTRWIADLLGGTGRPTSRQGTVASM